MASKNRSLPPREILVAKTLAFPIISIVRQWQVKRRGLPRPLACLGGVCNKEHLLLDAEPFVWTDDGPRPCCVLGSDVVRERHRQSAGPLGPSSGGLRLPAPSVGVRQAAAQSLRPHPQRPAFEAEAKRLGPICNASWGWGSPTYRWSRMSWPSVPSAVAPMRAYL
jgi:hypothetical protein